MIPRFLTAALAAALLAATAAAESDRELFDRWMAHVEDVYVRPTLARLEPDERSQFRRDPVLQARLVGYALSLQLRFVRRDSEEHRTWLRIEALCRAAHSDLARSMVGLPEPARREMEQRLLQQFGGAILGWHDLEFATLAPVDATNVPNFFENRPAGAPPPVVTHPAPPAPPPITLNPPPLPPVVIAPVAPAPPRPPVVTGPAVPGPPAPVPDPGLPSDALLGKWTVILEGRFDIPQNRQAVVVRKADGNDPTRYEAHYIELGEYLARNGYRVGQPAWQVRFLRNRQGRLDYEIRIHQRHQTGPPEQRDVFRGPEVYTLDPARPGILTLGNRPMWQR